MDNALDLAESGINSFQQTISNQSDQEITNCLHDQGYQHGLNVAHEDVQNGTVGQSHSTAYEHAHDACHVDQYGSQHSTITIPSMNPWETATEIMFTPTELNAGEQQMLDAPHVFEQGFHEGYTQQAAEELAPHFEIDWGHSEPNNSSIFDSVSTDSISQSESSSNSTDN